MSTTSNGLPPPAQRAGEILRLMRAKRGLSQLELSLQSGVSARHLSYIETGKAQPSRQMIVRLCEVMGISLRERNALLMTAGYAAYRETPLTTSRMEPLRQAIEITLKHHDPLPAFVINRHWDVLDANRGMEKLLHFLTDAGEVPHPNILLQVFDPGSVRPHIANWTEVAGDLLRHLNEERAATPLDERLAELSEQVISLASSASQLASLEDDLEAAPVMNVLFRKANRELRFFSTITTFATPRDVTAEDIRIECMFPLDEGTREFFETGKQD